MQTQNEIEALHKELSETKAKLEASEWVRKDNALRTYDGLTERVKELDEFAKMAVEVVEEISTAAPRDDDHLTAPISNEARLRASWRKANRFKSSDIYKKVVGK